MARDQDHSDITLYFERQVMNALIGSNVLPFCRDVVKIIVKYLP